MTILDTLFGVRRGSPKRKCVLSDRQLIKLAKENGINVYKVVGGKNKLLSRSTILKRLRDAGVGLNQKTFVNPNIPLSEQLNPNVPLSEQNNDSDSDSDSDYDSDLDSELYDKKYIEQYEELESRKLENDDINNLKDLFISKKSPIGVIKMCYDRETNAFLYYANSKDILYKYLETVGRFYVIENNCKNLFINSKDEYEKAVKVKEAKILERKREEDKKLEEEEARKNSIFARFKTYNTDNNNKSKIEDMPIIPEKTNKYIYKGKLCDYDEYIKSISCNNSTDNENDDFENLDYATFKKLEEKKNL